jgi:alkyl hydroperoxide reductase subunit AhpC
MLLQILLSAAWAADIGEAAPTFSLRSAGGEEVSLSQFKGKTVVLEWFNPGCPYVKSVYKSGTMQETASRWSENGVIWLSVNSGAKGKQGAGEQASSKAKETWGMQWPVLLDPDGVVGKAYKAKTTPHMFVIDPQGVLAYAGALDNAPMGKPKGGNRVPYLENALTDVLRGEKPGTAKTPPYGCSVKYGG